MAKPRSPAVAVRNDQIYAMFRRGASLGDLAEEFKITPQRVGQVIAAYHPEGDEDDDRSVYRGFMWRLFDEVQQIGEHPGWKMSPTGGAAYGPDGEPALDTNVQVQAKELQMKIIRELRLLDGRDRPVKRTMTFEVAEQEKDAAIAQVAAKRAEERREMEELRRKASVIPGEVVRGEIAS